MSISAQARTALFLVGAGVLLFGSAGTFLIPAFWLYLAILTAVFIVSFVMLDPELLHERMRPGGNPLPFGVMLATLVFSLHWVVAGFDRGRFHLSDTVPLPLQAVGFFVFAAGQVLAFWAMRVNRFFRRSCVFNPTEANTWLRPARMRLSGTQAMRRAS